MLRVRIDGALRTITSLRVMHEGTLRRIKTLRVMNGGTLRTVANFAPALTATCDPTLVDGFSNASSPVFVTSIPTTMRPNGGEGPYTYSWGVSGSAAALTPTNATTSFRAVVPPADTVSGTAICTVTDRFGSTATASVTYSLTNTGGFS